MKKFIAVLLYLFLMTIFFEFDIRKLIDFKQLFLVITGAFILYLPSSGIKDKGKFDKKLIGQNALWASIIQTLMLFFVMMVNGYDIEERFSNLALSCRPLFYGFCIWVILRNDEKQEEIHATQVYNDEAKPEKVQQTEICQEKEKINQETYKDNRNTVVNTLYGIEDCRQQFLQKGLTKRETEVAILVLKHMSNAEIADELYISETTVKKHMSNIFSKLNITKREQIRDIIH